MPTTPACATASAGASVNCSTINKNGEVGAPATAMAPGDVRNTTVRLLNTAAAGGLSGTLSLSVEPCAQTPAVGVANPANGDVLAGDLCGAVTVALRCASPGDELTGGPVSLTAFATGAPYTFPAPIPPAGYVDCTFTTTFPAAATAANLQGINTSQPMTWTFTQST